MKVLIIFGSSSLTGTTYSVIKKIFDEFDILLLKEKKIAFFDYENKYDNDDFQDCIDSMLNYDLIVFATPIYWYCISAQTKTFLDRITDLLYFEKTKIEILQQKKFAFVYTYAADEGYAKQIMESTFKYLKFDCIGYFSQKQNKIDDKKCKEFYNILITQIKN